MWLEAATALVTLTGLVMLAVLLWLWRRFSRVLQAQRRLVELNSDAKRDAPDLLRAAWPILQRAGVEGWEWHLDWYGQTLGAAHGGRKGRPATRKEGTAPEMRYSFALWWGPTKSENHFFAQALADTLALLLENDLWLQHHRVTRELAHTERLRTLIIHDVKNLAQCVQLLDERWSALCTDTPGAEAWRQAREAVALMRVRAERILLQLRPTGNIPRKTEALDVPVWFMQRCATLGLRPEIGGAARWEVDSEAWGTVFDNLLHNIADEARRTQRSQARVAIAITAEAGRLRIALHDPDAAPPAHPERLLQPFWSSGDGLGLGLKQARWAARQVGAELALHVPATGGLMATVLWPAAASPPLDRK